MKRYLFQILTGAVLLLTLAGCAGEAPLTVQAPPVPQPEPEPVIRQQDWSAAFGGLPGTAVLYNAKTQEYLIHNQELAQTRRSPCSTFKIVSSLTALETGVLTPEDSLRPWSGEVFWNDAWNQDMEFYPAFRNSCVWYFRQITDEIGPERMQQAVERLQYGNCDLSDWAGRLNTNNSNPALTGFWIESSLAISPQEQTEVMARIFAPGSDYGEASLSALKTAMQTETDGTYHVYGKTGMGKADGVVVDAWFTGFAQQGEEQLFFCVWLGKEAGVSSPTAREIALTLLADYYGT